MQLNQKQAATTLPAEAMRYLSLVACCLGANACAEPESFTVAPSGTYELLICKDSCQSEEGADAVAAVDLVIIDSANGSPCPFDSLAFDTMDLPRDGGPLKVNACFRVRRLAAELPGFIGTWPRGAVNWHRDSTGAAHLPLFRTADAGHDLTLRFAPDGTVRGRAVSYGLGDFRTTEQVVGRGVP